ncbi:MAG: hypothetical protein WD397_00735 [Wenzhouxiangellaceae bacterium]
MLFPPWSDPGLGDLQQQQSSVKPPHLKLTPRCQKFVELSANHIQFFLPFFSIQIDQGSIAGSGCFNELLTSINRFITFYCFLDSPATEGM